MSVAFFPLLPAAIIAGLAALCALVLGLAAARVAGGSLWRALSAAILLLWLTGPELQRRTGTAQPDIALLIVDHSGSMAVADRARLAADAASVLAARFAERRDLQLRRIDVGASPQGGTALFGEATQAALGDIPPAQQAGLIVISDGQVNDAAAAPASLPLTLLIPAAGEQSDRSLTLLRAPGYGLVGGTAQIVVTVRDHGPGGAAAAKVGWSQDGGPTTTIDAAVGVPTTISVPILAPGPTTVSIGVAALPGEASLLNNRLALTLNGVRDRLRVLLISGEPNQGERSWRRLLKADPAIDLVHFTILRPPGKDDGTPLRDLALIAFPTHTLFVDRLARFDLVILDRFSNAGLLPRQYVANIADYVRNGGGLLVTAGPEFAAPLGLSAGPLAAVLPALPDFAAADPVRTGAFRPSVTPVGERHPVTEDLAGDNPGGLPGWGDWYRHIAVGPAAGAVVLSAGPGGAPLLVLNRVDRGRVALLLSDQIWLWASGHEGGGPQAELLRRLAHWLMQEPALDETALKATIADGVLRVRHRSLTPDPPGAVAAVTDPEGRQSRLPLDGALAATSPGAWRVQLGQQTRFVAAAAGDPLELADLRATAAALPGAARWLVPAGAPEVGRLRLRRNKAVLVTGVSGSALVPGWLALVLGLGGLLIGWWRESA